MRIAKTTSWAWILVVLTAFAASPAAAGALATALEETDVAVALRYRFESVSRDVAGEKDAEASTLRTALAVTTGVFRGVKLFAEVENVSVIGDDNYNNRGAGSLANGMTNHAVVADPALTQFNQAYAEIGQGDTRARLGRQEIVLGDARFVGNVGWRQNHQSFEGLRLDHKFNDRVSLTYSYLDSVRRIFGDSRYLAGHVAEVKLKAKPGAVRAYALSLDWDDPTLAGGSTLTFGAEFAGSRALTNWKALYELEYAVQSDTADNPNSIDVDYLHAMVGAGRAAVTVRAGYEKLDGSAADGRFSTPLATLHKFNGWADLFLGTPVDGLVDTYFQVNGKQGRTGWLVRYHQFDAATGSANYGDEIDAQVTYKTSWDQTFALKAALYGADQFGVDTDKWMFWTAYSF